MPGVRRVVLFALLCLLVVAAGAWIRQRAVAQETGRQTTIVVPVTEYEWWLLAFDDNELKCSFKTDHEGLPTLEDVGKSCGAEVQADWQSTPPCQKILRGRGSINECSGLYLLQISSQPKQKEILIDLPVATVGVTLEGCSPTPPENLCPTLPALLLTGEEPLPNERITSIEGSFNGVPFFCDRGVCALPISVTTREGIAVEFWANSSFGDSTKKYTASVRVIDSGVSLTPGMGGWHVDVLSSQWRGGSLASCSQSWGAFPPVAGSISWLKSPDQSALLSTDAPYYYLAGRLIAQGEVDASHCPAWGLLPNGYADACGLEAAAPQVMLWQNQFDARIVQVSQDTGVPSQLMKNLFAQESQFWPGMFKVEREYGLGQITDKGADTILLWNPEFYAQFCPLVLSQEFCDKGYLNLPDDAQAMLRGALAIEAKSDCPGCIAGVDLTNAGFSIKLFANTLLASCEQTAQIVFNATGEVPGAVSSYEDLWRLSIANYHAGPGCVSYAVYAAWAANGREVLWDEVKGQFTEACLGVVPYVDKITQ